MQADMRKEAFEHIEKLPFSYFDDNKTGSIMSRIVNDLQEIAELAHHGPEDLIVSIFLLVGSFILMATINLPLTLIIFACIPFLVVFAARKRLKMSHAFTESRAEVAEVNATLENSIAGIRVSKAFDNAAYETEKFNRQNQEFVKAKSKAYRAMAEFFSGNGFIVDFLNIVILVAGGIFTYQGYIDFADFASFIILSTFYDADPESYQLCRAASGRHERLFALLRADGYACGRGFGRSCGASRREGRNYIRSCEFFLWRGTKESALRYQSFH